MRYETVIFDMDGTILNTLDDLVDSVNAVLKQCGYPQKSYDQIRSFLGGGGRNLMRLALPEGTSDETIDEVFAVYRPYYLEHCAIKTAPYPGIRALLSDLKAAGARLAVVSSKPDAPAQKLCRFYFGDLFDLCLGDRPGLPRKPDPAAIHLALRKLDAKKEAAVFVGDSEYDVLAARNAQLTGIAVSWGFRSREQLAATKPDLLVDTAEELRALLL